MSLVAIIAQILAEGEASAAEIQARAEAQAAQIQAEAEVEAARLKAEAEHSAALASPGALASLHNQASFAALRQVGQARDALIEQAVEQVRQQLMRARQDPHYPELLARLLAELLPSHHNSRGPCENLVLEADPLDQVVLERILAEQRLQATVDYCLVTWGGLNARSLDGRVRELNTLETRLARATPYLRQELGRMLSSVPRPSPGD